MRLIGIICIVWSLSFNAVAEKIVNVTTGEWAPFISKKLKHGGPLIHIITKAFALQNIKVNYSYYPWKRAMETAKIGRRAEVTAVWGFSEERARDFFYSDTVGEQKYVFFHLKEHDFDWSSYDDLKGVKIGATLGFFYGDSFTSYEKDQRINVQRINKDELNFPKILKKRIQIFPNEILVGYEFLQRTYSPEIVDLFTHHPKTVIANKLHVLFSKKSDKTPELLKSFNIGISKLRESGELDRIMKDSQDGKYIR